MVKKGTVLTVAGNVARVAPTEDVDAVSGLYVIPAYLNSDNYEKLAAAATDSTLKAALLELAAEQRIQKGDSVAFVGFSDYTGVILAKL